MSTCKDSISVESNLSLTLLDNGKVVDERVGHNIFLDIGREWLAHLIAYKTPSTLETFRDDRVLYMGLGIGGNRQLALSTANTPPLSTSYPGTNIQSDTNPKVQRLERPVRLEGDYSGEVWLGVIQPATFPSGREVQFRRSFGINEVSYGLYLSVPLSEVALFTQEANPLIKGNKAIAYDTFDTLSKTNAFDLEISWTLRF